jgi:serine protein kinase
MHEEPLHLLPRHLRKEFEKMLGVTIEAISAVCRFRLKEEFGTRYEEFPVSTRDFSERNRVDRRGAAQSIRTTRDTSVLIGSEDISARPHSEGDPRVLDLNGALNVGNRGMVEVHRGVQERDQNLHAMITATQEKVIGARTARHGLRRHVHRRALERGRVAEVQGRPHQRGDPRPHRGREGAAQSPASRGR